ncbi:MAG: TetR/AcrR family transcriptional regulator [Caldilinea sp.]
MIDEPLRKGEATQARILDAAYSLFMEQGYHGTSMRQIVERAGVTTGGVYNHFASKEEIWVAVFLERHPYRAILPLLRELDGGTLEEYVHSAAQRLVGELNKQQDLLHIMFIELVEFNGAHIPQLFERIAPELRPLVDLLDAHVGELRPIAPPLLARTFLGFFFSYYITEAMMPPAVRALMGDGALDAFVDIYLHGVVAGGEGRGAKDLFTT